MLINSAPDQASDQHRVLVKTKAVYFDATDWINIDATKIANGQILVPAIDYVFKGVCSDVTIVGSVFILSQYGK